jgi:hypothetical protein
LSWCQCMNGASPPRLSPEVVRVSPFPFIMATTVLFRLARSYGFSNMNYLSRRGDWLWSMQDENRGGIYLQSENVAPDPSNEAGAVTPWQALGHEKEVHAGDDGDEHVRVVRGESAMLAARRTARRAASKWRLAAGGSKPTATAWRTTRCRPMPKRPQATAARRGQSLRISA